MALADAVVLTVTGDVKDAPVTFTRAELAALPQHRLSTSTTVTDGVPVFEGFLMRDLLGAVGAEGETVTAVALNDYSIQIPISDFERFDVLGAVAMDGESLTPRDKGPIWIVYPRDDHPELQDMRYETRWVWQLHTLDVQ
nr:molybdopterin-dependent oxidoreductase [Lutimaribacter sp. EGI FJ00013]